MQEEFNIFDDETFLEAVTEPEEIETKQYDDLNSANIEKYFKYHFKFMFIDYNDKPYSEERLAKLLNRFESKIDYFCNLSNFFFKGYHKFQQGICYYICFNDYSPKVNTLRKFFESMNFIMNGDDRFRIHFKNESINIHRWACMTSWNNMFLIMKHLYSKEDIIQMINKHRLYDYDFQQTDICWRNIVDRKDTYLFLHNKCDTKGFLDKYYSDEERSELFDRIYVQDIFADLPTYDSSHLIKSVDDVRDFVENRGDIPIHLSIVKWSSKKYKSMYPELPRNKDEVYFTYLHLYIPGVFKYGEINGFINIRLHNIKDMRTKLFDEFIKEYFPNDYNRYKELIEY